jgi:ATP-dependent helicase/nuclease subunit B
MHLKVLNDVARNRGGIVSSYSPKIFSINAGSSFVDTLAKGILERFGTDPLILPTITVLLPNRRAVRSLREAFLRLFENKPVLLPSMRALGDVDDGEMELLGAGYGIDPSSLLHPIPPVRRQVLLARLVQAWYGADGDANLAPAQAWRLADDLAKLLDQVQTERVSFDALEDLAPSTMALHWNKTLEFLKIITAAWPKILADEAAIDPAEYRNQMLEQVKTMYEQAMGNGAPVIAAGSTGSLPATADLLSVISRLPNGYVILPSVDQTMPDEIWQQVGDTHPQAALKLLLNHIGASRYEVGLWCEHETLPNEARIRLLQDSLLPAQATDVWRTLPIPTAQADLWNGMRSIVAATRREEAEAIAVVLREVLETPEKTAALVTPDRQLALYVRMALRRWGVHIDDSGGDRAVNSLPGRLLSLLAHAASESFGPKVLLALLQHPLCASGFSRQDFIQFVRKIDKYALRGVRPASTLDGIVRHLQALSQKKNSGIDDATITYFERVKQVLEPFEQALSNDTTVASALTALVSAAEGLAVTSDASGADVLWRGEAGMALAGHLSDLIENTDVLMLSGPGGLGTLFDEVMSTVTVRPTWNQHPRLAIWGPLEARLQQADLMILGGLNEGVWPRDADPDPWMSRSMRAAFGLPSLDRRIGQSAHDFLLAASAPDVILTRSEKTNGTPTVPSRWWFRIEALARQKIPSADAYLEWGYALSTAPRTLAIRPPEPKPPVSARPDTLSVTQIQEWMRDPYALYAKKILRLPKLDALDERPNAATKGTLLHEALELFMKEEGQILGEAGYQRLMAMGEKVFQTVLTQPTVYAFWWPRFQRIARWFVDNETERRKTFNAAVIEGWARHEFTVQGYPKPFTLIAKADRIDLHAENGTAVIIDYKTGNIPTARQMSAGYAPQLPLEGWLVQQGAFEGLEKANVADLVFWKLSGGAPVQEAKRPVKDLDATIDAAANGLHTLIQVFSDENTPYLSNPRPSDAGYGDYDHLARVKEWQTVEDPLMDTEEAEE